MRHNERIQQATARLSDDFLVPPKKAVENSILALLFGGTLKRGIPQASFTNFFVLLRGDSRCRWSVTLALIGFLLVAPVLLCAQPLSGLRENLYAAWMREGASRERAGNWQAAAILYRRALEYRPGDKEATWRLARCLVKTGDEAGAAKLLRGLLAHDPGHAEAALLLGQVLIRKGKAAEAAAVLQTALKLRPADKHLLAETGRAWLAAGRAGRALLHLQKVQGEGAEANLLLGLCYLALNKPEAAERPLRAAVAGGAGPQAALALAEVYLSQKRWLEVVALTQPVTAKYPKNWRAWWLLGEGYLGLADVAGASEAFVKAVATVPQDQKRPAWLRAAKMALGAALPEIVLKLAPAAPAQGDPEILALQAVAAESLSRWALAAQTWEQAARTKPSLLSNAGRCWLAAGNRDRALRCLDRLSASDPAALQQAARLALASSRPEAAEKYLRQLLALRPADRELHLALAELLLRMGRRAAAARQAHEALPKDADAWRLIARICEAADMPQAAAAAALRAWNARRGLPEAELAARLLRRCGAWDDLAALLAEVSSFSDCLRLEVAHLALHRGRAGEALKALGMLAGAEAEALRAEAYLRAGQGQEAVAALARAWDAAGADRTKLAWLLRRLAPDAQARKRATELASQLALRDDCPPELVGALTHLLTAEFGVEQVPRRLAALARLPRASLALTEAAAKSLMQAGAVAEALPLVFARLQNTKDSRTRLRLLALAGRVCLTAGDIPGAAHYLSDVAAAKNQPAVLARLVQVKHSHRVDGELKAAMDSLARAWSEGAPDAEALFAFMQATCTDAELLAWARQYQGTKGDVALVQARTALALDDLPTALSRLREAAQTRPLQRLSVRCLLAAGRWVEAEPLVAALLQEAPEATDYLLAGDVAAASDDWVNAAWWYAFAAARGAANEASLAAGKLAAAADRAGMAAATREWLLEAAAEALPATERERAVAALREALKLPPPQ